MSERRLRIEDKLLINGIVKVVKAFRPLASGDYDVWFYGDDEPTLIEEIVWAK